jgi:hypothetical protein
VLLFFSYCGQVEWGERSRPHFQAAASDEVTAASDERNFLKLKSLKNYLRSTISQERLNRLTTLYVLKRKY